MSCLEEVLVIEFGGGLRGEEVSLASLEVLLKFWEETRIRRNQTHIMVTLKGILKVEMGGKVAHDALGGHDKIGNRY